jgi:hypothetical protein
MEILEKLFERWMESNLRNHDSIGRSEDNRLKDADQHLTNLDKTADEFEQKMEIVASQMEKWMSEKTGVK